MFFHGFPSVPGGPRRVRAVVDTLIYVRQACVTVNLVSNWRVDNVGLCIKGSGGMLSNRFETLVEQESYLGYRSESAQDPED